MSSGACSRAVSAARAARMKTGGDLFEIKLHRVDHRDANLVLVEGEQVCARGDLQPVVPRRHECDPRPRPLARLAQPPRLLRKGHLLPLDGFRQRHAARAGGTAHLAGELLAHVQEKVVELVAAPIQAPAHPYEELVHAQVLLVPPAKRLVQADRVGELRLPVGEVHAPLPGGLGDVRRPVGPYRGQQVHVVWHTPEGGLPTQRSPHAGKGACTKTLHTPPCRCCCPRPAASGTSSSRGCPWSAAGASRLR